MDHDLENEESAEEDSASPQLRLLTTEDPEPPMSTKQFWRLCTSHILSTWNARVYEFAAVSMPSVGDVEFTLIFAADIVYRRCLPRYSACFFD